MVNNSHQYQQIEQSSLKSEDQQFHHYQQSEQKSLNSDGQQLYQYQQNRTITSKQ